MIPRILAIIVSLVGPGLLAQTGPPPLPKDARLAIIGDSITEQKLYSKFIETYLMVCAGRTDIECFEFGWSGETATGFLGRMDIDLSLFDPTAATLSYGMNDGMYSPYNATIGGNYEAGMRKVMDKLKALGVRQMVVGSPSAVDPHFFQRFSGEEYNANLAQLGELGRKLAVEYHGAFADVHHTMISAMGPAKKAFGETFQVSGYDGIHPDPNGHLLMAQAFLKALGMDGAIGMIEVDLQGTATGTTGHKILSSTKGTVEVESSRWPFCFDLDPLSATSTRSLLPYCRFNEELNRFLLKVTHLDTAKAKVTWGQETQEFTREQLQQGINLAAEFAEHPFYAPFMTLMEAVAAKQRFETHAIWNMSYPFRSKYGDLSKPDAKAAFAELKTTVNAERTKLIDHARELVEPVKHTIMIVPSP